MLKKVMATTVAGAAALALSATAAPASAATAHYFSLNGPGGKISGHYTVSKGYVHVTYSVKDTWGDSWAAVGYIDYTADCCSHRLWNGRGKGSVVKSKFKTKYRAGKHIWIKAGRQKEWHSEDLTKKHYYLVKK